MSRPPAGWVNKQWTNRTLVRLVSCPQLAPGRRAFISRWRPSLSSPAWLYICGGRWRRWRRSGGPHAKSGPLPQTERLYRTVLRSERPRPLNCGAGHAGSQNDSFERASCYYGPCQRRSLALHQRVFTHMHAPARYRREVSGEHMTFSTPHFEEQLRFKRGSPCSGDFL